MLVLLPPLPEQMGYQIIKGFNPVNVVGDVVAVRNTGFWIMCYDLKTEAQTNRIVQNYAVLRDR